MKTLMLSLTMLLPLAGFADDPPTTPTEAPQQLIACPINNKGATIAAWREAAIAKIAEGNQQVVIDSMAACFPTTMPKCLNATKEYAQEITIGRQPTTPTPLTLKSELDLPSEFRPKDADGNVIPGIVKIPDNIFEIAAEKNWKVVDYKTRSTGGFDGSPNLVLVVLPNWPQPNQDVFLQISPPQDLDHPANGADPKPNPRTTVGLGTLTVITADKTVNPPVGQLRLMHGDDSKYQWNNLLQAGSCTSCHSVPLRSISPRGFGHVNWENRMTEADQALVSEINQMMKIENFSWGTDQNGYPLGAPTYYHPYGWAPANSPTRTEEYVKNCFNNRQDNFYMGFGNYQVQTQKNPEAQMSDWTKVRNAMNCVDCHNNKQRGYLHAGFSFDEMIFKVVVDRSMPPDSDLTTDERLAVINCLRQEYDETDDAWRKAGSWMKKMSCGL